MKIIYDRQREIYDRLKDQEQQRTILPTEKRSSLSAQTVGQWRQERIMSPLRPLITHGGGRQWLKIGDGNLGSEAQWLLREGAQAHATDLAPDLLEIARQSGLIASYGKENAEQLSFDDESFDYALIKEAFHHFPRPWLALYEAFRICRIGVVLLEPNGEHPRPLSTLLRWIRRKPSTIYYHFENVGNFVYAPSAIELEKYLLGLGGGQIAFRFYNDHWVSREADESPVSGGSTRQAALRESVMRSIRYRNLLGRTGLVPFGKIASILFKQPVSQQAITGLHAYNWSIKQLPLNPYSI